MSLSTLAADYCPPVLRPAYDRIQASPLGVRLARGVFWSMAGAIISRGLMVVATVCVARLLGKTGYGELGIIQSTVGMFGVFAGFGLGLTATKHVAEFRVKDPARAGRILGLSGVVALVTGGLMALGLAVFAPWLASHTINAPQLAGALRIGALILFISALNGAQTGALSGFEAFKTIAHVNLFVGLLSFPILIAGAFCGGLTGAVWALAVNLGFNWLFNHLALRREARRYGVPFSFKNCSQEWPILLRFSLPVVLGGIMVTPANWVCGAMLVNQPNGYDEMGMLSAALVFQGLAMFVSGMLSAPLLAMITNSGANTSDRLAVANILSSWALGVFAALPLLCFPELAQLAFGSAYNTHAFRVTLALCVFCMSIMTYKAGLSRVLAANSLMWWGFLSNSFWAVILILSALFLVDFGAAGIAVSLTIAYVLNTLILVPLYYSRKLVPKGTLLSIKSVQIWSVLAGLVLLNVFDVSLYLRALAFLPCVSIAGLAFRAIATPGRIATKWRLPAAEPEAYC
ncbi:MAG: oligosaccharide flippase family protein [Rhodopirellula sp.]|nr:oligosaccharide flippase family protein [Rhodopirellula sp.]